MRIIYVGLPMHFMLGHAHLYYTGVCPNRNSIGKGTLRIQCMCNTTFIISGHADVYERMPKLGIPTLQNTYNIHCGAYAFFYVDMPMDIIRGHVKYTYSKHRFAHRGYMPMKIYIGLPMHLMRGHAY